MPFGRSSDDGSVAARTTASGQADRSGALAGSGGGTAGPESQLAPGVVLALPGGVRLEVNDAKQAALAGRVVARPGKAMLSFSGSLKVLVAVEACDMRKGFNGLHALVTERLGEDPKQGALFVFSNRRHTRIKILCWDGTGFWVLTKRLEAGTFSWPKNLQPETTKLKLTPQALALLTDGVDLRGAKLRPWYEREA